MSEFKLELRAGSNCNDKFRSRRKQLLTQGVDYTSTEPGWKGKDIPRKASQHNNENNTGVRYLSVLHDTILSCLPT